MGLETDGMMEGGSLSQAGLATVEIVGFQGQTAPTTRFGYRNCTNYHINRNQLSTIGFTDSEAVLI